MKTRAARFLQRLALGGALTFALTGCGIELADLIELNEIKVAAPFQSSNDEGGSSTPAPTSVSATYVGNQTLALTPQETPSVDDQVNDLPERLIKDFLSTRTPLTPCKWQFGYYAWEFATHCGAVLSDTDFEKTELKAEDVSQLLQMKSFGLDATFSNTFTITFTPSFFDSVSGAEPPQTLDLLLTGLAGYVSDAETSRPSLLLLYAAGESATLNLDGSWILDDQNNPTGARYTLDDTEFYLRAAATGDTAGDIFMVLADDVTPNTVKLSSLMKFGTNNALSPKDIESVDYTVTLGDVTLSSQ